MIDPYRGHAYKTLSTRVTPNLHVFINVGMVLRQWLQVPSSKLNQIFK